jgi:hypothetical protein
VSSTPPLALLIAPGLVSMQQIGHRGATGAPDHMPSRRSTAWTRQTGSPQCPIHASYVAERVVLISQGRRCFRIQISNNFVEAQPEAFEGAMTVTHAAVSLILSARCLLPR